jgi:hypothetical protein
MDGQVRDMPKEALAQKKKWKFAKDLDRLGFLGDAGIALSVLDEINVEGKSAVGVLVKAQGQPDTQLYFDKTTGLLVKRVQRVLDPSSGKELQGEVIYSDYQEKDGLKHYGKTAAFIDGKKVIDARVTEVEFFEKLDPKVFARP